LLKKILLFAAVLFAGSACTTLEERLAKRVGCNHERLAVHFKMNVPAYSQYEFICEGKKWTCRDAPFVETCNPGWHRDKKGKGKRKGKKKRRGKRKRRG